MLYHTSLADRFAHPHWPHLDLLWHQPLVIQLHLLTAVTAFVIATVQVFGPKGTIPHRILGWSWVILMATVAGSSFFIRQINLGHFSFIHVLSVVTLVFLVVLVYMARRHRVGDHRRTALGLYTGALIIAGLFTFLPGRLMWWLFFG